MYNFRYRPKTFDEVIGQAVPKRVLKKVAMEPLAKPQVYLLQGAWGSGKSTLARVFARAINCKDKNPPCLECASCRSAPVITDDPRYMEYDSAQMGNVQNIKSLREGWAFNLGSDYRVITFDECHTVSREGQAALLEFTEDPPPKVFILFATTDMDKMIKPLISRSFVLEFNTLLNDEIEQVLDRVASKESFTLSDEVKKLIVRRSAGHARDAVMLLERYSMLGEKEFVDSLVMADSQILEYFRAIFEGDGERVKKAVQTLTLIPLSLLNQDWEKVLMKMMEKVLLDGRPLLGKIDEQMVMKIFGLYIKASPILKRSMSDFCSFLFALYGLIRKDNSSSASLQSGDRYRKL